MDNEGFEATTKLSKYLAHCGVGSRRETADAIKKGLVTVNGLIEKQPFYEVKETDTVAYRGKDVKIPQSFVYFLVNKPKDIVTDSPNEKQRDIASLVSKKTDAKVYALDDMDSEDVGLVVITNDQSLVEKRRTAEKKVTSHYELFITENMIDSNFDMLNRYGIKFLSKEKDHIVVVAALSPTEVRKILTKLEIGCSKVDRVQYSSLTKRDLPRGWNRPLTEKEVIFLKHF